MTALGLCALRYAREDLDAGVREEPAGSNDGPELRRLYLDPMRLPPGSAWCAAALWSWVRRAAADLGAEVPAGLATATAKGPIPWLSARGLWLPRGKARPEDLEPGMLVIWDRGAWHGHTGLVATVDAGTFAAIEGNSGPAGDRVAEMPHTLSDPRLLGFGWLPSPLTITPG